MTQTVTGMFDNFEDAREAVRKLETAGVPHADISIVANDSHNLHGSKLADRTASPADGVAQDGGRAAHDAGRGAQIGGAVGGVGGLLAGLGALAIPGVGPVVAAGWLVSTVVGAVSGAVVGGATGGLVGSLTHAGVAPEDAHVYAEGVRRGGTLVTAKVDDTMAAQARDILAGGSSVKLGERRDLYRSEGWSTFDEKAGAYTPEQVQAERARYERV